MGNALRAQGARWSMWSLCVAAAALGSCGSSSDDPDGAATSAAGNAASGAAGGSAVGGKGGASGGNVAGHGGSSGSGAHAGSSGSGGVMSHAGSGGSAGAAHAGAGGANAGTSANAGGNASSGSAGGPQGTGGANAGMSAAGGTNAAGGAVSGGAGGVASGGSAGTGAGGVVTTGRPFPDTSTSIAILADELPSQMTSGQVAFAASHYVGSQKLILAVSQPIRALNPSFLVLHYHLGIWQSAPGVSFILDGNTWGNDYPTVTMNEGWFWHDQANQRVASTADQKLLMNLNDPGFRAYWASSIAAQVAAGDYDGVFADSSSPALLQAEVGDQDARLSGTGAEDTAITEWGGKTYIDVWEDFMTELDAALGAQGIPLIPNQGSFITGWDKSNYGLTAGVFSEGFAQPNFATSDWIASTNELLTLSATKILILQNYLSGPDDLADRRYYLANYLLVRGAKTYLDYFDDNGPLEWFPEWGIDTGAAMSTATKADDLKTPDGIYRRDFAKASVLVNPTDGDVTVDLGGTMKRVEPTGGGSIDDSGAPSGSLAMPDVTSILVPAHGAEILLK